MTVTTLNTISTGTGDGVTLLFNFDYDCDDASTVEVFLDGVQQFIGFIAALNVGAPGGTITFAVAPANGVLVLMQRVVPVTQETVFPTTETRLNTDILSDAYDKLTMICQQLLTFFSTTLSLAIGTDPGVNTVLPPPVAGGIPIWNAAANAFEYLEPVAAGYVVTDNGVGFPFSSQPPTGGGGGGGGNMFGPTPGGAATPGAIPVWLDVSGRVLDNGVVPDTAGFVVTDTGTGFVSQALPTPTPPFAPVLTEYAAAGNFNVGGSPNSMIVVTPGVVGTFLMVAQIDTILAATELGLVFQAVLTGATTPNAIHATVANASASAMETSVHLQGMITTTSNADTIDFQCHPNNHNVAGVIIKINMLQIA